MTRVALFVTPMVLLAATLGAQQGSDPLQKTVDGTVDIQKNTQKLQDDWAEEQAELLARYRAAKANVAYLTDRNAIESDKSAALDDRIAELERRLTESDRLNAVLQDTLMAVYARLEDWVSRDLPFLMEERTQRLTSLENDLVRPDVTGAEKLRRLLESLQVEANYGSTVEVEHEEIQVGGQPVFVDLLRLGRISVFWRTPDGKRVGEFDRASGQWVELPGKYKRPIGDAMDMAARIKPITITELPLGRITR